MTLGGGTSPSTIAIMHYSGPPAVGGIETLMAQAVKSLSDAGHRVVLIVGEGEEVAGAELRVVPGIAPWHGDGRGRTQELEGSLEEALAGCDACWMINLLTVTLHPGLSAALFRLIPRLHLWWVHWCADISASSAFVQNAEGAWLLDQLAALGQVRHVAISEFRQRELAGDLRIPAVSISVITPAVDLRDWLGVSAATLSLFEALGLLAADPIVLVPSKLLPHKRLDLAVEVAGFLRKTVPGARMVITGSYSPHEPSVSGEVRDALRFADVRASPGDGVLIMSDWCGPNVPREIVRGLFAIAGAVYVPSQEEGFGMPLLEAALFRLPAICSDLPALREAASLDTVFVPLHAPAPEVAAVLAHVLKTAQPRGHARAVASMAAFDSAVRRLARER